MKKVAHFEKVSFTEWERSYGGLGGVDSRELQRSYDDIRLPQQATEGSAGYDFFVPYDLDILVEDNGQYTPMILYPTGIRCILKKGFCLVLCPKSGLGTRYGFRFRNTVGIIDSDYYKSENEGHIQFSPLVGVDLHLKSGDKMFQGIFTEHFYAINGSSTEKRNGGHGSTGR